MTARRKCKNNFLHRERKDTGVTDLNKPGYVSKRFDFSTLSFVIDRFQWLLTRPVILGYESKNV